MADQVVTMRGEPGDLLAKIQEIKNADKAMADSMRASARASKEGFQGVVTGATAAGKGIADNLIPGITQIGTASGLATFAVTTAFKLMGDAIERETKRATKFADEIDKLREIAARTGQLEAIPALQAAAASVKAPDVTADQRKAEVASVLGLSKGLLSPQQMEAAVRFGVQGKQAGVSGMGGTMVGLQLAHKESSQEDIEKVARRLPDMTDEERSLAMSMGASGASVQDTGERIAKLRQSGQASKVLRQLQGVVSGDAADLRQPGQLKYTQAQEDRLRDLKSADLATQKELDAVKEAREAAPRAGKGARREWEDQERALQRKMTASARERTEIDLAREEDPEEKRMRLERLRIAELPEDQRLDAASAFLPGLLKPGQRDDARAFARAPGLSAMPDVIARSEQKEAELEKSSPSYREARRLTRKKVIATNIEDTAEQEAAESGRASAIQDVKNLGAAASWTDLIGAALGNPAALLGIKKTADSVGVEIVGDTRGNNVSTEATKGATN